jgi:hypothetical protein
MNMTLRKCLRVGLMNQRARQGRERRIRHGKRDKGGFSLRLPRDPRRTAADVNVLELEMIEESMERGHCEIVGI